MKTFFRGIWRIVTFPFMVVFFLFRLPIRLVDNFIKFLNTEPEDRPLSETLTNVVSDNDVRASLWKQIDDLRSHLVRMLIALAAAVVGSFWLTLPLMEYLARPVKGLASLQAIEVTEEIGVFMRVALTSGITIALPYIAFEIWRFVAPGLKPRERKFGLVGIPLAGLLFALVVAFTFEILIPAALPFLGGMRYGLYPEVYIEANPVTKQLLLTKLVESYLFKDILAFQRVRYSQTIVDLARALAYQIGQEVNENELANRLKIDRKTVLNYIDILEKSFVIMRLPPFSRNPRREIGKQSKIYFLDLGIRNALIGDFNDLSLRPDRGAVWENFLLIERHKTYLNQGRNVQSHFWRTYGGAEVDYIEETGAGQIEAYEFKYGRASLTRGADSFSKAYAVKVHLINQENYLDLLLQATSRRSTS